MPPLHCSPSSLTSARLSSLLFPVSSTQPPLAADVALTISVHAQCAQYPDHCLKTIVEHWERPLQTKYMLDVVNSGHGGFVHSCFLGACERWLLLAVHSALCRSLNLAIG